MMAEKLPSFERTEASPTLDDVGAAIRLDPPAAGTAGVYGADEKILLRGIVCATAGQERDCGGDLLTRTILTVVKDEGEAEYAIAVQDRHTTNPDEFDDDVADDAYVVTNWFNLDVAATLHTTFEPGKYTADITFMDMKSKPVHFEVLPKPAPDETSEEGEE